MLAFVCPSMADRFPRSTIGDFHLFVGYEHIAKQCASIIVEMVEGSGPFVVHSTWACHGLLFFRHKDRQGCWY